MVNRPHDESSERYLLLLDPDPGTAEEKYLALFERLVRFFEWRGVHDPDDLAQETLRRGFARIAKGADVYAEDPVYYFFGIAKNVWRERWKDRPVDQSVDLDAQAAPWPGAVRADQRILLEQCLSLVGREDRELLVRYHTGDREQLRDELNVDANSLRVRVHRALQRLKRRLADGLAVAE